MSARADPILKPCPHCGGEVRLAKHLTSTKALVGFVVVCDPCGVNLFKNKWANAVAAWNRRSPQS